MDQSELKHLKNQQKDFEGNEEHLLMFYHLIRNTPPQSDERREALTQWTSFNTRRTSSYYDPVRNINLKTSYEENYVGIDLSGLVLEYEIIGPIDLRGAKLSGIRFNRVNCKKGRFKNADLRNADLSNCWLLGADFEGAKLQGANFSNAFLGDANLRGIQCDRSTVFDGADLQGANLALADLRGASVKNANLQLAQLLETDLRGADISGCKVFGVATWSIRVDEQTKQGDLVVTPAAPDISANDRNNRQNQVDVSKPVEPLHIDSIEHAHLMHLLLNPDLSNLLESVTSKGVLLLGRFSGIHGEILDSLRQAIRSAGFVPIKFDFRKPDDRTLKETVLTLAGLCRFVIADITEASSIPLELATIVKEYKIPIVPIHRCGYKTFSMFESIEREFQDRVIAPLEYTDQHDLLDVLNEAIILPALKKWDDLVRIKKGVTQSRKTSDYRA